MDLNKFTLFLSQDEKSDLLNSLKEKLQTSEIQTLQLIATLEQKACQLKVGTREKKIEIRNLYSVCDNKS